MQVRYQTIPTARNGHSIFFVSLFQDEESMLSLFSFIFFGHCVFGSFCVELSCFPLSKKDWKLANPPLGTNSHAARAWTTSHCHQRPATTHLFSARFDARMPKGIATRNRCIASSNKCPSSNKKLSETSATLVVTGALLVVTRSY